MDADKSGQLGFWPSGDDGLRQARAEVARLEREVAMRTTGDDEYIVWWTEWFAAARELDRMEREERDHEV